MISPNSSLYSSILSLKSRFSCLIKLDGVVSCGEFNGEILANRLFGSKTGEFWCGPVGCVFIGDSGRLLCAVSIPGILCKISTANLVRIVFKFGEWGGEDAGGGGGGNDGAGRIYRVRRLFSSSSTVRCDTRTATCCIAVDNNSF